MGGNDGACARTPFADGRRFEQVAIIARIPNGGRRVVRRPSEAVRKGLARFKALPRIPDYFKTYHLKRIAISLMLTGQGFSHEAISHYLNHKGSLETTMMYDLGLVDPLRPVTARLGVLLGV